MNFRTQCSNSHIGYLHTITHHLLPINKIDIADTYIDSNDVQEIKNFIPDSLAKKAVEFVSKIPFNSEILQLNDTDNKPQDNLVKFARDVYNTRNTSILLEKLNNKIHDPLQWIVEKYCGGQIYRYSPITLESFYGSPIYDILLYLQSFFQPFIDKHDYILKFAVLQRTGYKNGISLHTDDNPTRIITFMYYLTPDDWPEGCGGDLIIYTDDWPDKAVKEVIITDDLKRIKYEFNKLVMWNINSLPNLKHAVSRVETDKPRIALVGFIEKKE